MASGTIDNLLEMDDFAGDGDDIATGNSDIIDFGTGGGLNGENFHPGEPMEVVIAFGTNAAEDDFDGTSLVVDVKKDNTATPTTVVTTTGVVVAADLVKGTKLRLAVNAPGRFMMITWTLVGAATTAVNAALRMHGATQTNIEGLPAAAPPP